MILLGTIVNALGIVAGAVIGVLLTSLLAKNKKLAAIPDKLMKAVGLCVIYIGISGTFENKNTLVLILSMVIGALIGELIDIDQWVNRLGDFLEKHLVKGDGKGKFAEGFVTCSLMFCVGAMTINGAFQDAIGKPDILIAKAVIDGIMV